jgi:predicted nucleic acid-binding protein
MLIVADTGPLISLAVIDKMDLLETLFYEVVIPEAVWQELEHTIQDLSIPQAMRFRNNIIQVTHYEEINAALGPGETEAILLYEQIHADKLLIEDSDARLYAETRGIRCTGTLGILIEAKMKTIIPVLRPLFGELLSKRRFFTKQLLNTILSLSNEMPL